MDAINWLPLWLSRHSIPRDTMWKASKNIHLREENVHLPLAKGSPERWTPPPLGYINFVSSRFPKAVCTSKEVLRQEFKMWVWGETLSVCNLMRLLRALREPGTTAKAWILGEASGIESCAQAVFNAAMSKHNQIRYLTEWQMCW